ncbi:MAG TPA: hypothetical protein PLS49_07425 [Candidatus Woesebacteria bacterium]|nr:hypothetical protein [Candidatus Woesebacteria bacterium]
MSELFIPSEDMIKRKAEVDFSGCNLEAPEQKPALELHERLQIAYDQMSPEERKENEDYLIWLSEYYNGPGGP